MTDAVRALLASFDRLTESERHEAAVEILRRVVPDDKFPEPALIELANELFCMLDAEEAELERRLREALEGPSATIPWSELKGGV